LGPNMKKEAMERSEKMEVTEIFCGPLKDKPKDPCLQFYEEFAEVKGKRGAPMEGQGLGKESGKNNPIANFCWPLSGKEKEECIQSYEDALEEKGKRIE
jgi:hypothetical protein